MAYTANQIRQAIASGRIIELQKCLDLTKKYKLIEEVELIESSLAFWQRHLAKCQQITEDSRNKEAV